MAAHETTAFKSAKSQLKLVGRQAGHFLRRTPSFLSQTAPSSDAFKLSKSNAIKRRNSTFYVQLHDAPHRLPTYRRIYSPHYASQPHVDVDVRDSRRVSDDDETSGCESGT